MHSLSHTLHSKLSNNSKSNLHSTKHGVAAAASSMVVVVAEDKENRRDMVNRQSQQMGATTVS